MLHDADSTTALKVEAEFRELVAAPRVDGHAATDTGTRLPGRFNLFQRMMLRWRRLHPYNAVHALPLPGPLNAARLEAVASDVLARLGITRLVVDSSEHRFAYRGGRPHVLLEVLPATGNTRHALAAEMERQLNRPFALADGAPIRFFALECPDRREFWLGMAYDHFIAGGDSMTLVIADVARAYAHGVLPQAALDVYPPTYLRLIRKHPGAFLRSLACMPELVRDCKRAVRPRFHDADDAHNCFSMLNVDATDAGRLCALARQFGVTLHDLMVAVLLQALSAFAHGRHSEASRKNVGVASIVNLRQTFAGPATHTFGQFLASLRIVHPVPQGIGIAELARAVNAATCRIKRQRLHLRTLYALTAAAVAWRYMSDAQRQRFYTKHYPAWAGVSMLDVSRLWPADAGIELARYVRAVSTGPIMPAIVSITRSAQQLSIGVSYRRAAYDAAFPAAFEKALRDVVATGSVSGSQC
jgi:hypothetical protein